MRPPGVRPSWIQAAPTGGKECANNVREADPLASRSPRHDLHCPWGRARAAPPHGPVRSFRTIGISGLSQNSATAIGISECGNCSLATPRHQARLESDAYRSIKSLVLFQLDDEEERAKVQEIANYIRGKLKTEQKVSLNELGKRFPMPSEEFDTVRRLMGAEGCIEVAIPGDRWIVKP